MFFNSPSGVWGSSYAPALKSSPTCKIQSRVLPADSSPYTTRSLPLPQLFTHQDHTTPLTLASQSCSYPKRTLASTPAFAPCSPRTPRYPNGCSFMSFGPCSHATSERPPLSCSNCTPSLSTSSLCFNFLHSSDHYLMSKYNFQRVKNMTCTQASSGVCQWFI